MNDEQYADWAAKIRAEHPPDEANRILETGGPEQHANTTRDDERIAKAREWARRWPHAYRNEVLLLARLDAAEERASQLEHERDRFANLWNMEAGRAQKAEGELFQARREANKLRAALEQIASSQTVLATPGVLDTSYSGRTAQEYKRIARAALAGVQAKEQP